MNRDWSKIVSLFRSSGQTHQAFCFKHKVPVSTFQYYLYKKPSLSKRQPPDFVRLGPLPERYNNQSSIEFHLGQGRFLKLPQDYPVSDLRELLSLEVKA